MSIAASVQSIEDTGPPGEGLVIEGRLESAIAHHKMHLMVARRASVTANVQSDQVVFLGALTGNIYSTGTVFLANGSNVHGNIHCDHVVIEDGAKSKGNIGPESHPM